MQLRILHFLTKIFQQEDFSTAQNLGGEFPLPFLPEAASFRDV